jgi:outer membrane protein assembly factor BamE (lipoprotein component of BamABCDE complex)
MFRIMVVALVALTMCVAGASAGDKEKARAGPSSTFTLGRVQKELRPGLSQAEVVERLGSPNILTRDAEGREAWVYDRVSSEVEVTFSGVGVGGLGSGVGSTFAGLVGLSAGKRSEKAHSSQRTLTVVIRFSAAGAVESFSWHDSRF